MSATEGWKGWNGMKHFDAHTIQDAKKILQAEGVKFDRICVETISCKDYYTGEVGRRDGIHIYFMLTCRPHSDFGVELFAPKECDVAYLTPGIACLTIHEKPRPWAPEFLAILRPINWPRPELT
jgi:hypothetical protein